MLFMFEHTHLMWIIFQSVISYLNRAYQQNKPRSSLDRIWTAKIREI